MSRQTVCPLNDRCRARQPRRAPHEARKQEGKCTVGYDILKMKARGPARLCRLCRHGRVTETAPPPHLTQVALSHWSLLTWRLFVTHSPLKTSRSRFQHVPSRSNLTPLPRAAFHAAAATLLPARPPGQARQPQPRAMVRRRHRHHRLSQRPSDQPASRFSLQQEGPGEGLLS